MSHPDPSPAGDIALDQVVERMADAVVIVDAASRRVTHTNRRAEIERRQGGEHRLAHLAEEWHIFHADGRPYTAEEWPLVRSIEHGEEIADEEFFSVDGDGPPRWFRCNCSPLLDAAGAVVAAVSTTRDVTDRKADEQRLGYFAGVLEHSDDAIVALDGDWFVRLWNGGAQRMYGWTAEEVVGRHVTEVARLEIGPDERAEIRRATAEQGRWRGEVIVERKDGSKLWVELITVALDDEQGRVSGFLGIHRDVTARREAQAALLSSSERTETILESITDAFIAVDRDWRYTYVNARALHRMEVHRGEPLTASDVLGRGMWELFPDVAGSEFYDRYHEAMRDGRSVSFEAYSPPTDEWIEAHAFPSASGLSVYYRDVSERRRAQDAREALAQRQALVAGLGLRALASDALEPLIDEAVDVVARTLEVESAEIVEAVEEAPAARGAQRSSEVVVQGVDGPYGVLRAVWKRGAFSDDGLSFMQAVANVVGSAVQRMQAQRTLDGVREDERRRIARDLHDGVLQQLTEVVAAAGSGGRPASADDVAPAIGRAVQLLRGAIYDLRLGDEEDRSFGDSLGVLVAVHEGVDDGARYVLDVGAGTADRRMGRRGTEALRIVSEALANARRHAGAGTIRVRAWGSGGRLSVEVCDDGRGFDGATEPWPLDRTGIKGMRERAALLDADLTVRTRPGAGTRVCLELMLHSEKAQPPLTARVLLVEDHVAARQAIAAMFRREPDFEVVGQAGSLAEARGMLEGVDVAVLDLGLPDGDGGDLIAELRDASPGAQALVLTAALDRVEIARAVQRGAAGTLDKTARLDQVVGAVRRLRAGEVLLPPEEVVEWLRLAGRPQDQDPADRAALERLTPRELEVLQALAEGLDSQAIAERLHITGRTERNHVARILPKLGAHSRLQAVVFAVRHGLVEIR